jgi:hypothetical protein
VNIPEIVILFPTVFKLVRGQSLAGVLAAPASLHMNEVWRIASQINPILNVAPRDYSASPFDSRAISHSSSYTSSNFCL